MRSLEEALSKDFHRWYCPSCNKYWWLGINFTPSSCPFCSEDIVILYAQKDVKIEKSEELSVDELTAIFKKYS